MSVYTYIGYDEAHQIMLLESPLDFNSLECVDLNENYFTRYYGTNWGGHDEFKRTMKLKGLIITGRWIIPKIPLTFIGKDYDCGFETQWKNTVIFIGETKPFNY